MRKIITTFIKQLEKFEKLSDKEQIAFLHRLKKVYPKLTVIIESEEIKC